MLLGGNGAVVWAEQWTPSGLTSLLIATVPLWLVMLDWLRRDSKPSIRIAVGLAIGFGGVALLMGGIQGLGQSSVDITSAAILIFGTFLWANGSLYSRKTGRDVLSPLQPVSLQMTLGGLLMLVVSGLTGEYSRIKLDQVSLRSTAAWMYLVIFGSLVAFTCYIWLLQKVSPARVSTYAYVNPIVAMLLGSAIGQEPITIRNLAAAATILAAVILITTYHGKPRDEDTSMPDVTGQPPPAKADPQDSTAHAFFFSPSTSCRKPVSLFSKTITDLRNLSQCSCGTRLIFYARRKHNHRSSRAN